MMEKGREEKKKKREIMVGGRASNHNHKPDNRPLTPKHGERYSPHSEVQRGAAQCSSRRGGTIFSCPSFRSRPKGHQKEGQTRNSLRMTGAHSPIDFPQIKL